MAFTATPDATNHPGQHASVAVDMSTYSNITAIPTPLAGTVKASPLPANLQAILPGGYASN